MGKEIVFDYSKTAGFISEEEMKNMKSTVMGAKDVLTAKSGAGNDYLGWIDLPVDYDKEEFARIKKAAEKIQGDSDVLLVIGIGGSYLGARAAIEVLSQQENLCDHRQGKGSFKESGKRRGIRELRCSG